ncbi:MAG: hypothetical protein H6604_05315 [Flavobacteriales bacterium]|nr:hypothetical protein [Flavobacteriales bacterium]
MSKNEKYNTQLIQLFNRPCKLIKEGGKFGINSVGYFIFVLGLFSISNITLFLYSLSRLASTGFEARKVFFILLIFVVGFGFTLYSAYRMYQYLRINVVKVIYGNLSSIFQSISELIINKTESLFKDKFNLTNSQLKKALDFGRMINIRYHKMPKFLRTAIILLLNKIPIVDMLLELKEEIFKGNKLDASVKLYNRMDKHISNSIFRNNNTTWIWWLFPLNMGVLFVFIKLMIE